jgi:hypothetical protein
MGRMLVALALLGLLAGCSTAHTARPLGKGNSAVHLSVGGPIGGIGVPNTFTPLTTVTFKHGLTDRADVYVGWHVLETFLNEGNLFFDLGASYYLLDQKGARPGLSGAFTVSPLINKRHGWAMLDFQFTASWAIGRRERHLIYVGAHNTITPSRSEGVTTPPFSFSPYVGGQLRLGKKRRLGLGLEVKWLRPYVNTKDGVIGYVGVGPLGALSFLGGVTIFIGKDTKPGPQQDAPAPQDPS